MPDVITVACGVCGAQKKDSNHWWMVWVNYMGEFCCASFDPISWSTIKQRYAGCDAIGPGSSLQPAAGFPQAEVACGEEHAQTLFARWLVARSFLAPSQRPVSAASAPSAVNPDLSSSVPLPNPEQEKIENGK